MSDFLSKEILDLKIGFDYLLSAESGESFEIRHKILYLVSKSGKTSPRVLIEILGIAKSNLAICCRDLLKEGLILRRKDESNLKEIFYYITEKGQLLLNEKFEHVEKTFARQRNKEKIIKMAKELSKMFE